MKKLLILLLIITSTSCKEKPDKTTLSTTLKNTETMDKIAKQEIENLLIAYQETLNTSNAEKATALYTKDGVFMPSGAPTAIGSEQIKGAYNFVFSQIQLNIEFYIEEIVVENSIAFAVTNSKGTTLIRANGNTIPEENRELFVLEKINSQWKIAKYMFNKTH